MGQYGVTSVRQARHCTVHLKVPKGEIFLTELIILSYPIWTGDLGTKVKKSICMKCKADIRHFVFLLTTEYAVKIIPRLLSMR